MDNQAELRISVPAKNRLHQSGDFEKYKYYRDRIFTLIRLNKKYSLSVGNNLSTEMLQAKHSYMIYLNSSKSPDTSLFLSVLVRMKYPLRIINHMACTLVLHNFQNGLMI